MARPDKSEKQRAVCCLGRTMLPISALDRLNRDSVIWQLLASGSLQQTSAGFRPAGRRHLYQRCSRRCLITEPKNEMTTKIHRIFFTMQLFCEGFCTVDSSCSVAENPDGSSRPRASGSRS